MPSEPESGAIRMSTLTCSISRRASASATVVAATAAHTRRPRFLPSLIYVLLLLGIQRAPTPPTSVNLGPPFSSVKAPRQRLVVSRPPAWHERAPVGRSPPTTSRDP